MPRPSNADRLSRIHQEALLEASRVQTAQWEERQQCLADRRFYAIAGAQWEGNLGVQFEKKLMMEVNKVGNAIDRIVGEYRKNKISIRFIPRDGSKNSELADTCASMFRADEYESGAQEAYDNAFEEAAAGGFGAIRLRADYENEEDEESERMRVWIEPIPDADNSVFFDLDARRRDKADAKRCWVLTQMSIEGYREQWGDEPTTWPKLIHQSWFDWSPGRRVTVAEYYVVEKVSETVHWFRSLTGEEKRYTDAELAGDEDDPKARRLDEWLQATGWREVRRKKVKRQRVHKYWMSGGGVLEDCGYIAGKYIPVIPVYGKRVFIDGIERASGRVRRAKDAQRLKNMQFSKLAEIAATSSVEKPIFTPEQVAGHEWMWAEDHIHNNAYLLINAMRDQNGNPTAIGPQAYTKPPSLPPALAALLELTEQDMKELLGGEQNVPEQIPTNTSGVAVEALQAWNELVTYVHFDNFVAAKKWLAHVWLHMARDIYIEEGRKILTVDEQGEPDSIELMRPTIDKATGETVYEADLSRADMTVWADVGPSSSSRRASMVRTLTQMASITEDPESKIVLTATACANLEGEGLGDLRNWFRKKLISVGAVTPTEDEARDLAEAQAKQQPDPNAVATMALAEQAVAEAEQARAKSVLTAAQADKARADTAAVLAELDVTQRAQLVDEVRALAEVQVAGQQAQQLQQQMQQQSTGQPLSDA